MMLPASLCLAALLSVGTAKAPSQAPGMWHADLRTTGDALAATSSSDAQASTSSVAAPTGAEVILVWGIQRG